MTEGATMARTQSTVKVASIQSTIAVPWDGTPIKQLRESAGESPS